MKANTLAPAGYYVYTPVDGDEDGKFLGLSLEEAMERAKNKARILRDCGESNTTVYVNEVETCNYVWHCD